MIESKKTSSSRSFSRLGLVSLFLVGFFYLLPTISISETTHDGSEILNPANNNSTLPTDPQCITVEQRCTEVGGFSGGNPLYSLNAVNFTGHNSSGRIQYTCDMTRISNGAQTNFFLQMYEVVDDTNPCQAQCPDPNDFGFEEYFDSSVAPEFQCVSDCEYEISSAVNLGTNINGPEPDVLVSYHSTGDECENGNYSNGNDNTVPIESQSVGEQFEVDPEIDFAFDATDTNCGYFNGEPVCLDSVPDNGCMSLTDGTVLCDDSANTPPAPDTGVPQQPAVPSVTITNNTTNETTNVHNSTTVNNSTTTASDNDTGNSDQAQYCMDNPNAAICDSSGTPTVISGEVSINESGVNSNVDGLINGSINDIEGVYDDRLTDFNTGLNDHFGLQEPTEVKNKVLGIFPPASACSDFSLATVNLNSVGISHDFQTTGLCEKFQPVRNIGGLAMYALTVWVGFGLLTRPIGG